MFAPIARSEVADLERVEALVRDRYGLGEDALVLVTEEHGRVPGLPERLTTVLFWPDRGTRHRVRVFRPVASVTAGDLPPAWLRGALVDDGDGECC